MNDIRYEDLNGGILEPVQILKNPFRGKKTFTKSFFFSCFMSSMLILRHLVFLVRFRPLSYPVQLPTNDLFEHKLVLYFKTIFQTSVVPFQSKIRQQDQMKNELQVVQKSSLHCHTVSRIQQSYGQLSSSKCERLQT